MNTKPIAVVFWENVKWHVKNRHLSLYGVVGNRAAELNKGEYPNVHLGTVQKIAKKLDIDDYAILFE